MTYSVSFFYFATAQPSGDVATDTYLYPLDVQRDAFLAAFSPLVAGAYANVFTVRIPLRVTITA